MKQKMSKIVLSCSNLLGSKGGEQNLVMNQSTEYYYLDESSAILKINS